MDFPLSVCFSPSCETKMLSDFPQPPPPLGYRGGNENIEDVFLDLNIISSHL